MNELETNLKLLIIEKYGSMKKFCEKVEMPWTTLDSILKRGVANSNITNVLKITRELGLDAEKLVDGSIVPIETEHPTTSTVKNTRRTSLMKSASLQSL